MNLKTTLLVWFSSIFLVIIVTIGIAIAPLEGAIQDTQEFHGKALQLIQKISLDSFGAIDESFAYLITGDTKDRNEFLSWAKSYESRNIEFVATARLDINKENREAQLFKSIRAHQGILVEMAQTIFSNYELNGVISSIALRDYETKIEELMSYFNELIEIESDEIRSEEVRIISTINKIKIAIYSSGILYITLLFSLGMAIQNKITNPIKYLIQSVNRFGDGESVSWPKFSSRNEIQNLADSFSSMADSLTAKTDELIILNHQKDNLVSELQSALAEVKTLRGILPICSFCKKIRNDEGYWNQIELYIAQHSGAKFTHGICPECIKTHYPQVPIPDDLT